MTAGTLQLFSLNENSIICKHVTVEEIPVESYMKCSSTLQRGLHRRSQRLCRADSLWSLTIWKCQQTNYVSVFAVCPSEKHIGYSNCLLGFFSFEEERFDASSHLTLFEFVLSDLKNSMEKVKRIIEETCKSNKSVATEMSLRLMDFHSHRSNLAI